jgi:predicted O-linked N-acetylglucosamine transferase (SPINDLY family)
MISLQAAPDDQAAVPIDEWLDAFLVSLAAARNAPADPEIIRSRLEEASFNAVLGALGRARPGLGDAAEIGLYRAWIEANAGTSRLLYAAWFNLGVSLSRAGDNADAIVAYGNALALRPDLHGAALNLGLMLELSGQSEEALATWHRATQPDAERIALEIQQGRLLEKIGRLEDAERMLYRVLLLDADQPDVLHHWLHIRQRICQWPIASSLVPGLSARDLVRKSCPLTILALTDDIDLQRAAAAAWIARKTEPAPRRLAPSRPYPHERVRIGYMSSDFCSHAMCYLVTELFERHDRDRFEVFGYCSSRDDGSQLRQRVLAAFDHRRMIRGLSDEQAARCIRDDEIDILIELNGITDGSRLAVLRWRPAPVQATWLGYIGPVPLPELDYLLCDDMVIPPEHRTSYRPSPLTVGSIYQANDSRRSIGPETSREAAGLPEDCFLFCCFSKHYKITEELFAAWMEILRRTGRSILWLIEDNIYSRANLLAAARTAGIAEDRLVFSPRANPDLYLSRLELADLFLDTFPYNAGTIASDAIRMRLPLLTLCGQAFASRMAASLLHAAGAHRGIATSLTKYVDIAVHLATDPAAYASYKALFGAGAWGRTIGDIGRFTREFEDTWWRVIRSMREIAPDPLV